MPAIDVYIFLLRRRSRQRERLNAPGLSICSSVAKMLRTNTWFSKKNKQFKAMISIDVLTPNSKSYIGFAENPLLNL